MIDVLAVASGTATEADRRNAQGGPRFGRMDAASQLCLLAVEKMGVSFDDLPRERIGICLVTRAGSMSTDVDYWKSRLEPGGPSPTLFTYTLPSAPLGEVAIRFKLKGPNLCLAGDERLALEEGAEMIRQGAADGCVCIACDVATEEMAAMAGIESHARAAAHYLRRGGKGGQGAV